MADDLRLTTEFDTDTSKLVGGIKEIKSAVANLEKTLNSTFGDMDSSLQGLASSAKSSGDSISDGISKGANSISDATESTEELKEALDKLGDGEINPNGLGDIDTTAGEAKDSIGDLGESLDDVGGKLDDIGNKDVGIDFDTTGLDGANESLKEIEDTAKRLPSAMESISSSMSNVGGAMVDFAEEANTKLDSMKGKLEKTHKDLEKGGKWATKNITAPIVGIGAYSIKSAMDYETALAGVAKTTDLAGEELKNMDNGLVELSKTIPVSITDLAGIAEAGGQLGIDNSSLLEFTETVSMMAVASNMTTDEISTSFAKFANITKLPQSEIRKLGSTLVRLGNNTAATESDIMAMSMRLASSGKMIGLTESQTLGLSATMVSLGISAEAGGTNMSKTMQTISSSVAKGEDGLEGFAKVANMTADEFSKAWKEDPQSALQEFLKGIDAVNKEGGDVTSTLKDLGITGQLQIDTILRMAGAHDLLGDTMAMGNDEWEKNNALVEEANVAFGTTKSQLELTKNALERAGRAIGDILLPVVADLANKLADVLDKFSQMEPEKLEKIIKYATILAVIGPILLGLAKVVEIILAIIEVVKGLTWVIKNLGVAIQWLSGTITALNLPIWLVILAVIALVAIIYVLMQYFDELKNIATGVFLIIERIIWKAVVGWVKIFKWLGEAVATVFFAMGDFIGGIFERKLGVVTNLVEKIGKLVVWLVKVVTDSIVKLFGLFGVDLEEQGEKVKESVEGMYNNILGFMDEFKGKNTEIYSSVKVKTFEVLENMNEGTNSLLDAWQNNTYERYDKYKLELEEITSDTADKAQESGKNLMDRYTAGLDEGSLGTQIAMDSVMSGVVDETRSKNEVVKESGLIVADNLSEGVQSGNGRVQGTVGSLLDNANSVVGSKQAGFNEQGKKTMENVSLGMYSVEGRVQGATGDIIDGAKSTVDGYSGTFFEAGKGVVGNIASGIQAGSGLLPTVLGKVLGGIRNMLPFSPPKDKTSPLADIHKNGITTQIAKGIINGKGDITNAMNNVLDFGVEATSLGNLDFNLGAYEDNINSVVNGNIQASVGNNMDIGVDFVPQYVEVDVNIGGRNYDKFVQDIAGHMDKRSRRRNK